MTDAELLEQFEQCALPFDQWTHKAHVKVAFLYLQQYSFEEAVSKMRFGIQAYNETNHVPDSATMGYNETTTCALMKLIGATIAAYSDFLPTDNADAFCDAHPQLMSKHILRFFYSPERRLHPEVKSRFVEPDLTQLPRILTTD